MKHNLGKCYTLCTFAKKIHRIVVEVCIRRGVPLVNISGNASRGVKESIFRIRSGLEACGWKFPLANITIHLSPQNIPKQGNQYDLPVAIAILKAMGELGNSGFCEETLFLGELDLEGNVLPLPNLFQFLDPESLSKSLVFLPLGNRNEASFLGLKNLRYLENLSQIASGKWIESDSIDPPLILKTKDPFTDSFPGDFNLYPEQKPAFQALETALAGRHHILITGSSGCGKTMLAELCQFLQSPPPKEEWLEIAKYNYTSGTPYSIRPFRNPHHSITANSLIGGGNHLEPGEMSKAHKGILYLDELGEIQSSVIQNLREPLERKFYSLTRNNKQAFLDADFQLVATSNLCPCGQLTSTENVCVCKKEKIRSYLIKIAGPVLDRIPIVVEMTKFSNVSSPTERVLLQESKERIREVIQIQIERNKYLTEGKISYNSEIREGMWNCMGWKDEEIKFWNFFTVHNKLSIRERNHILGVSRTLADLKKLETVSQDDLYTALSMRQGYSTILKVTV